MPNANESSHLLIRADAGGDLGTGHVMRMIALAQAWQDRGGSVTLVACQCPSALECRLKEEGIDFILLDNRTLGGEDELAETIQLGKSLNTPWIVIDGYHFKEYYQKTLKENGFKILAIDDYGHCAAWNVDIVLNQNIQSRRFTGITGLAPDARSLVGTQYALLRREFRDSPERIEINNNNSLRILITFGGVDPVGATLSVIQSLNCIPLLKIELKILAGPANPRLEALRSEALNSSYPIEIIPSTKDMPSLYRWCDRVISAGGSSCYEWMFYNIPGWVSSIAANQDQIVCALLDQNQASGLASFSKQESDQLTSSLKNWIDQSHPPRSSIVDGFGSLRVAAAIAEVQCWVRPVWQHEDARFLFELANQESVRSAGLHTDEIIWEDHVLWLQKHCNSDRSSLMIIEMLNYGPVGQIRFHEVEPTVWEIGISIHSDLRKVRLAFSSLFIAMKAHVAKHKVTQWKAEIRNENLASQRLFAKLEFSKTSTHEVMQTWILNHPKSNNS